MKISIIDLIDYMAECEQTAAACGRPGTATKCAKIITILKDYDYIKRSEKRQAKLESKRLNGMAEYSDIDAEVRAQE